MNWRESKLNSFWDWYTWREVGEGGEYVYHWSEHERLNRPFLCFMLAIFALPRVCQ